MAVDIDIHAIKRTLDGLEEDLIARVPEHYFQAFLLPILAGDPGHQSLEPWIHVAGSLFNRVAVFDAAGNKLFTLPPMGVSPQLSSDRDARSSLFEIMGNYDLRAKVSPLMARNYLESALVDKIQMPERQVEEFKIIDDVLIRYGREPRLPKSFYEDRKGQAIAESGAGDVVDEAGDDL